MKITAELHYLRMSPRKVRAVANVIRGKRAPEAERALRFLTRRAAAPIAKLLRSAVANAKHNFQVASPEALVVSDIRVRDGPTLKRFRPRAFGRAATVRKRTSHVRLALEAVAVAPERERRRAPVVRAAGEGATRAGEPPARERSDRAAAFHERAKVEPKSPGFVRRIFQRKAI